MKKIAFLLALIMLFSFTFAYAEEWICPNCGKTNTTKFCTSCGTKHDVWICPSCGAENSDAFCGNCGTQRPVDLSELYGVWEAKSDGQNGYFIFLENGTLLVLSGHGLITQMKYKATTDQITFIRNNSEETDDYRIDQDVLSITGVYATLTRSELSAENLIKAFPETQSEFLFFGAVTGFSWKRTISTEKQTKANESGWNLPAGAILKEQKEEIHHYDSVLDHYEETEVQRSRQVIDHYETYYTYDDNGDGTFVETSHERPVYTTEYYTETEQQPIYTQTPVYATKYFYTVSKWEPHTETSSANDHNPAWPTVTISETEHETNRTEEYYFTISSGLTDETHTFKTSYETWKNLKQEEMIYLDAINDEELKIIDQTGTPIAQVTIVN